MHRDIYTQVELQAEHEIKPFWLKYEAETHSKLKVGDEVVLVDDPDTKWEVTRLFTNVSGAHNLPENARTGTIAVLIHN